MTTATKTGIRAASYVSFRRRILAWFEREGRTLPWRGDRVIPWGVFVSEFMLQQTQVDRVIPKYEAFMRRWPTPSALAASDLAEVIRMWSGLGYNRRARNLREASLAIVERHGGKVPSARDELAALPGIGPYTSGAVAAFAFNDDVVLWDTNVRRVILRHFHGGEYAEVPTDDAVVARDASRALPKGRSADWYGALMDLGSAVCVGRKPACGSCPLSRSCVASRLIGAGAEPTHRLVRPQERFEGSRRQIRGAILRELSRIPKARRITTLERMIDGDVRSVVTTMEKEGLVRTERGSVRLA